MSVLETIVEARRAGVAAARAAMPEAVLRGRVVRAPERRPFRQALDGPGLSVIAEVKRSSPSAGAIDSDADAAEVAATYAAAGAKAISVLTEPAHFGGDLADLSAVRDRAPLPVLRKDFIVDPYQILESRVAGADAILLIVAAVGRRCHELLANASEFGLDVLVEVHTEAELLVACEAGADIVGINNRDLDDLSVDLGVAERLMPLVPDGVTVVAESGIGTPEDAARMKRAGADAILVGTALMSAHDPTAALAALTA